MGIVKKYIGDKAFYKKVLLVAVPMMIQQFLSSMVNVVDNLMVGQLGDISISVVALVNRYYMISFYGVTGFVAIASVFIAQFHGARNSLKMQESFRISFLISVILSIPFLAIGLLFAKEIVVFFSNTTSLEMIDLGTKVLSIITISLIPTAISTSIAGAMRSIGDTKTPLYFSIVAIALNVSVDYLVLFGNFGFPRLGVVGGAWSTLFARVVEMLLLLYVLKKKHYEFKSPLNKLFVVTKDLVLKIVKKGLPLTLNEILWAGGMTLLWKFYATRGDYVLASFSITNTTSDMFFSLFGGMAAATTIMVANYLGANKLKEAKDNAYKLLVFSVGVAIVFACLIHISAYIIPLFYTKISNESISLAQDILKIMSIFFIVYVINTQCYFILRAGGDTKATLIMDSGFMILVNLPIVGVFAYFSSVSIIYVYIVGQLTDILKLVVSWFVIRKEKWVANLTIESENTEVNQVF